MILGIEHIAVLAKDVTSLKDWYINMFELRTVYDNGKGTYFLMAPDGSMLEILSAEENEMTPNIQAAIPGLKEGHL